MNTEMTHEEIREMVRNFNEISAEKNALIDQYMETCLTLVDNARKYRDLAEQWKQLADTEKQISENWQKVAWKWRRVAIYSALIALTTGLAAAILLI